MYEQWDENITEDSYTFLKKMSSSQRREEIMLEFASASFCNRKLRCAPWGGIVMPKME